MNMYSRIKDATYKLLDPTPGGSVLHQIINNLIISLIVLNAITVILETVDELFNRYLLFFRIIETITVIVFTAEYLLRIWCCTSAEKYRHPLFGRIRFIASTGAIIDLVAILPFYLPLLFSHELIAIRLLLIFRFFRFLKLGRYLKASSVIVHVIQQKREELLISLAIFIFLIISASTVMYHIEHDVQPDKFSSIPEIIWWAVGTLTTVGYGDMEAVTPLGKTLTSVIAILGIGVFALPAGILASGFSDELHQSMGKKCCPHCGTALEEGA